MEYKSVLYLYFKHVKKLYFTIPPTIFDVVVHEFLQST